MKTYLMSQVFSIIIAAFLVVVFYILMIAGLVSGQNFISDLILIIIAIVLLAIFSMLAKIERALKGGKRK